MGSHVGSWQPGAWPRLRWTARAAGEDRPTSPADRHQVGSEIVHAVAEIEPEEALISDVIEIAVRYVEDHRQLNRLAEATRLAGFVRQNQHRADADTQAYAEVVLDDLYRALANSAIGQRIADELERESLADIRQAVAGKRFLFVGGVRSDWYEALRLDLGFSGESEWRESTRAEPPSMHQLRSIVRAGKIDGLFIFTDFVAHKTSDIKAPSKPGSFVSRPR